MLFNYAKIAWHTLRRHATYTVVNSVGLALVVAVPAAYVGVRRWLQDFAYRIDLSPWIFLLAGALTLGIALLTVSTHALRAARLDPATTLRDE